MFGLTVKIRTVAAETPPAAAEAMMTDADGRTHFFRCPLMLLTTDPAPFLPADGVIRCTVVTETAHWTEIDTALPDQIESTLGQTRFRVHRADLTDNA